MFLEMSSKCIKCIFCPLYMQICYIFLNTIYHSIDERTHKGGCTFAFIEIRIYACVGTHIRVLIMTRCGLRTMKMLGDR